MKKNENYVVSDVKYVYLRKFEPGIRPPAVPVKELATLYYIVSGELICNKNGCKIPLKKNDFLFWDYGDTASIENPSDLPCLCYIIGYKLSNTKSKHSDFSFPETGNISEDSFQSLFPKLYDSFIWTERDKEGKYKVFSIFYMILHKILSEKKAEITLKDQHTKLDRAVQYIYANYASHIEIEDLCNISAYSRTHLHRLFMEHYNMPPRKFINNFKIERAKLILGNLALNIAEVAEEAGFKDTGYFCKTFKSYTSYTPLEYRKNFYSDIF